MFKCKKKIFDTDPHISHALLVSRIVAFYIEPCRERSTRAIRQELYLYVHHKGSNIKSYSKRRTGEPVASALPVIRTVRTLPISHIMNALPVATP